MYGFLNGCANGFRLDVGKGAGAAHRSTAGKRRTDAPCSSSRGTAESAPHLYTALSGQQTKRGIVMATHLMS